MREVALIMHMRDGVLPLQNLKFCSQLLSGAIALDCSPTVEYQRCVRGGAWLITQLHAPCRMTAGGAHGLKSSHLHQQQPKVHFDTLS